MKSEGYNLAVRTAATTRVDALAPEWGWKTRRDLQANRPPGAAVDGSGETRVI